MVQAVTPSVVFVETEHLRTVPTIFGRQQTLQSGAGSGVVIHPAGYIVTNYHVVEGAREIRVSFEGDTESYSARLMSFVREEDLALLLIQGAGTRLRGAEREPEPAGSDRALTPPGPRDEFPTVRLGTSADLMPGERVVAIGSPHGQTYTVSTGIISGLHRDVSVPSRNLNFRGLIQTDASINFGNSGGPLLNIHGELIGINTVMNTSAENIGFAIPVDRVRQVLEEVLFPDALQVWLGVDVEDRGGRAVITRVWDGGPAASGELAEGDRVVAINGEPVTTTESLHLAAIPIEPGATVELTVEGKAGRCEAEISTWDALNGDLFKDIGLAVTEQQIQPNNPQTFLMVQHVRPESASADLGVEPGDVIPAVRPRTVPVARTYWLSDRRALQTLLSRIPKGTEIEVDAYRDMNGDLMYRRDEQLKGVLIR